MQIPQKIEEFLQKANTLDHIEPVIEIHSDIFPLWRDITMARAAKVIREAAEGSGIEITHMEFGSATISTGDSNYVIIWYPVDIVRTADEHVEFYLEFSLSYSYPKPRQISPQEPWIQPAKVIYLEDHEEKPKPPDEWKKVS